MDDLARLGLTGAFQVHVGPTVLTIDERAHQVFRGFEGGWGDVLGVLRGRLGAETVVYADGESVLLGEASPREVLVVPAQREDHPGGFYGLVWVVDRLLGPGGCPWDQKQTHESLKKYLLEESYELLDQIDAKNEEGMIEELGDVILQPLMHTQIKKKEGKWDVEAPVKAITEKLVRRHPHVFGDLSVEDADEVLRNWDKIKKSEKGDETRSVLAGVPGAMPALLKAMEVSKRAARAGFEWLDVEAVWDKFEEETREVREALASGTSEEVAAEFGDLLFTVVNLARWSGVDAEDALRTMVERFRRRFMRMEELAGGDLGSLSAEEWDRFWEQAKAEQSTGV